MPTTIISSRQFDRSTFQAFEAARQGHVFITTYGRVTHALLSMEEYQRLVVDKDQTLAPEIGHGFSPGIPTP